MMDYTKYRLKPEDEIKELLKNTFAISIFWCKKCYKEFSSDLEPECEKLREILRQQRVKDCLEIDFLCNSYHTSKKIKIEEISRNTALGVVSCGLGIQLISQIFPNKKIYALADSIPQSGNSTSSRGYHGISLGTEKCSVCGQCYLNTTAGICPIVNCSKSLLNGPCGGAKNGKCEIGSDVCCAWEEIYKRLNKQEKSFNTGVHYRNFNIFGFDEKKKYSLISIANRNQGYYGGVHPLEGKEWTNKTPLYDFPAPDVVYIFLSQHTGSMSNPIVKEGDNVRMGQKIGESTGLISSCIHSSVSGRVLKIEEKNHPSLLKKIPAIIIENDGKNILDASVTRFNFEREGKEKTIEFLKDKGIVGLGGAMFPTHVKFMVKNKVENLIINGCECEPYLNADCRIMIEYPEKVFKGIEIIKTILNPKNTTIAIEDNKEEATSTLQKHSSSYNINISSLKTKYPQGAEKVLIKKLTGREVPENGLPIDVGAIVVNISTVIAIYRAIYEGMPLIDRAITISGEEIKNRGNFFIKIGTPLKNIIDFCFDKKTENVFEDYNIMMGGAMMGIAQSALDSSVIKGTSGYTILKKYYVESSQERECIKCGRCVDVCPVDLLPLHYAYYGKRNDWEQTIKYRVKNCIECGCCQYICSAKIDLLGFIRKGKKYAYNKS
jgi:electron transport complex protein RnfC